MNNNSKETNGIFSKLKKDYVSGLEQQVKLQASSLIIDTDPGVDDALAIMYLLKAGIQVSAITTVFGNSSVENTTNNALKILSILGKKVLVYKGEESPLKVSPTFATSHGDSGFGGYKISLSQQAEDETAVNYLISLLESEKEVTIICLGPTTNIAKLALLRPDLIKNIGKLIILGGALGESGNISQFAEFNVYNDPDALDKVLSLGVEKYLIPINICRKVFFTSNDFDMISNSSLSGAIKEITRQYIDYYTTNKEYGSFEGGVMYDLLATVFYTNPEIFEVKESFVEVSLDLENIGETIEQENSEKTNCKVITGVDVEKLKDLFFNAMNK